MRDALPEPILLGPLAVPTGDLQEVSVAALIDEYFPMGDLQEVSVTGLIDEYFGLGDLAEVTVAPLWEDYFVEVLAKGHVTAAEWTEHFKAQHLTVSDVCRVWQQARMQHPTATEQMGFARDLWQATTETFPPEQRDLTKLTPDEALYLGEIAYWAGDISQAKQIYEAVLKSAPEGPTTQHASRGLMAYRVAQCFEQSGDIESARDWYLKCAAWGSPEQTGGYDVRSEGYGEAARMCRRLGRDDEAEQYYLKAIRECSGWGKAISTLDWSGRLLQLGRFDEAVTLLRAITDGSCGTVPAAYALWALADAHCTEGDATRARECLGECRRLVDADGGASEMIASVGSQAKARSTELDAWEKEPIRAVPPKLEFAVSPDDPALVTRLTVSAFGRAGLSLATPEWLTAVAEGEPSWGQGGTQRLYRIGLSAEAASSAREGEIVVTRRGTAGLALRVPVKVTVRAAIVASPSECFFGFVKRGERRECKLTLRALSAFRVSRAEVDSTALAVTVDNGEVAATHQVTVTCSPGATDPVGAHEAKLRVIGDREGLSLVVPVCWHTTAAP